MKIKTVRLGTPPKFEGLPVQLRLIGALRPMYPSTLAYASEAELGSFEFQYYAAVACQELEAIGFPAAPSRYQPQHIVMFQSLLTILGISSVPAKPSHTKEIHICIWHMYFQLHAFGVALSTGTTPLHGLDIVVGKMSKDEYMEAVAQGIIPATSTTEDVVIKSPTLESNPFSDSDPEDSPTTSKHLH